MAEVRIKGIGWKFCPYLSALKLKQMWERGERKDQIIEIGDITCRMGDIGGFQMTPDKKIDNQFQDNLEKDYTEWRTQQLRMAPEVRAKTTARFELCWKACNKGEMPQEAVDEVVAMQTKYFKENPNRTMFPSIYYKNIILRYPPKDKVTVWDKAIFRVMEKCETTDKEYSRV